MSIDNNEVILTETIDIVTDMILSEIDTKYKSPILESSKLMTELKTLAYYNLMDQLLHQTIISVDLDSDGMMDEDPLYIYDPYIITQLLMSCQVPIALKGDFKREGFEIFEKSQIINGTLTSSYIIEFPGELRTNKWKTKPGLSMLITCVVNIVAVKVKNAINSQMEFSLYSEHSRSRIAKFIRESIHYYYITEQINNLNDIIVDIYGDSKTYKCK